MGFSQESRSVKSNFNNTIKFNQRRDSIPFVNKGNLANVLNQIDKLDNKTQQGLLKRLAFLNEIGIISIGLDELMQASFTDVDTKLVIRLLKELSLNQDKRVSLRVFNHMFFNAMYKGKHDESFNIHWYKPLDSFIHKCTGITREKCIFINPKKDSKGNITEYDRKEYITQLQSPLIWEKCSTSTKLARQYSPNYHLPSELDKTIACEGRLSNKVSENTGKEVYWCKNNRCFNPQRDFVKPDQNNKKNYSKYTLLDIGRSFGINISDEMLSIIYGYVNKLYAMKDVLVCHECHQLVYPEFNSNYAYDRFNVFGCRTLNVIV